MQHRLAVLTAAVLLGITGAGHAGQPPAMDTLFEPYAQLLERHLEEYDLDGGGLVSAFDYDGALAYDWSLNRPENFPEINE
ncbi:hypothetical protein [Arhodomonas sp. SL1]|uniref:hypothetical protein n=1 Tax=Arhodomonas sp. SL1 TaxID=3425691 RepID=UPI003F88182A